jgi:hypothetical protein
LKSILVVALLVLPGCSAPSDVFVGRVESAEPAIVPVVHKSEACKCLDCKCDPCNCKPVLPEVVKPFVPEAKAEPVKEPVKDSRYVCDGNSCRLKSNCAPCQSYQGYQYYQGSCRPNRRTGPIRRLFGW